MKEGIFGSIPIENWKKSKFDLSHDVKLTGQMAYLMPVLCEEVLPGDNWRWKGNLLVRFAPLLAPIMHRVKATFHCFHVANRTLTTAWKPAITGGDDGESTERTPYIGMSSWLQQLYDAGEATFNAYVSTGTLWDYLGYPTFKYSDFPPGTVFTDDTEINIFPFLAYQQIWQYYYRDQNVDTNDVMLNPIAGGATSLSDMQFKYAVLKTRAWQKDAFTSALPWPQRGPDVLVPLETEVDTAVSVLTDAPVGAPGPVSVDNVGAIIQTTGIPNEIKFTGLNATLTINDLRTAIVVQKWLELKARSGNRYNEFVLSQYGATVPDYRIDQPEYIGGGTQYVDFSEVLTSAYSNPDAEDAGTPVPPASMYGHGISAGSHNAFNYAVKEHGWIMVLLSVMPETSYQEGLPRKYTRLFREDYAYPVFAGLGEQEVLSREVYYHPMEPGPTGNLQVFGYQQRFWEYKHIQNRTCGEFKTTLNYWTMTRIFGTRPQPVSNAFIYADPTQRIFAVTDTSHKLWMHVIHELSVLRPLPYYSVPGVLKV